MISCSDASSLHSRLTSVTRTANSCSYTITPDTTATSGDATFSVTFTSDGGHSLSETITVEIGPDSSVTFTPPSGLKVGRNRTLVIDALTHITENSAYTVTCGEATGVDTLKLTSVTRTTSGDGCTFTVDPIDTLVVGSQGDTTFTVAFTSDGGATANGTFTVNIGPDSTISYSAPDGLKIGRNYTLDINVLSHASEVSSSSYSVSCGDATGVDNTKLTGVTHTGSSCTFTVDPIDTLASNLQGDTTFTIPLTSTGGHTLDATFTVNIGPDSSVTVDSSSSIAVAASRSRTIDFASYASDGDYTVSCGTPTTASSLISIGTPNGCSVEITAGSTTGSATVSVAFTSDGGATARGSFTFAVGATSNIVFNAPAGLKVGTNRTKVINALSYATDGGYTITCGDATNIDTTELQSVVRATFGDGCSFTITPKSVQGAASFTVPLTSEGGDTENAVFSITVGPESTITYSGPTGLLVGRNRTLTIDASGYVEETAGSGYVISCSDASSLHARLTSVARTANSCSYTITPSSTATSGAATFTIAFTSDGGHSRGETITVEIGPDSTITYTPPSGLKVGRNRTLEIDVLDHITEDSVYTVSCGDATGVDNTKLTGVTHTGSSCTFTVDPIDALGSSLQGDTTFTVPLTSTGGHRLDAAFTVNIGPDSTISYTSPTGLFVGRNRSLIIDASGYVEETAGSGYAISCSDASNLHSRLSSVTLTANSCSYTITPASAATSGNATFEITFTSDGGHSLSETITVEVGPDSTITYSAPDDLSVAAGRSFVFDASGYVSETAGSGYVISCGDATVVETSKITVTRNGCIFTVTASSSAAAGVTIFVLPFSSTGGHSLDRPFSIAIGATSDITFTAPVGGLSIPVGQLRNFSVASYATDGDYTISCRFADASRHSLIVSVANTGCDFTVRAGSIAGAATLSVIYNSSGGDEVTGVIPICLLYTSPSPRD